MQNSEIIKMDQDIQEFFEKKKNDDNIHDDLMPKL